MRRFEAVDRCQSEAVSLETRLIRKDGSLTLAKLTVSLLRDREGWPSHLLAHVEAIQERMKAETRSLHPLNRQSAKEERYRSAFETSPDGVLIAQARTARSSKCNPGIA